MAIIKSPAFIAATASSDMSQVNPDLINVCLKKRPFLFFLLSSYHCTHLSVYVGRNTGGIRCHLIIFHSVIREAKSGKLPLYICPFSNVSPEEKDHRTSMNFTVSYYLSPKPDVYGSILTFMAHSHSLWKYRETHWKQAIWLWFLCCLEPFV